MTTKKNDKAAMQDDPKARFYQALFSVQCKSGKAKKDGKNPHHKSTYATLESVQDVLNPLLEANGLVVKQVPDFIGGEWILITEIALSDGSYSEGFKCPLMGLEGARNPMQALGSAETYARRYSLMGYFKMAPSDDDGNAVEQVRPSAQRAAGGHQQRQQRGFDPAPFIARFAELGISEKDLENRYQKRLKDLTPTEVEDLKQYGTEVKYAGILPKVFQD